MSNITRRGFTLGLVAAAPALAACSNAVGSDGGARLDARANATRNFMFQNYPGTRDLADKANGMLIMPVVTQGGFFVGGGYGRGVLQIDEVSVDYYSAISGSIGLQFGAQQYTHVLFFMTSEALERFRRGSGWVAGADIQYAFNDEGGNLRADTTTSTAPVVAVIFGQAGLLVGASIEGMKYSRIIP
jgi:lipid-binding SYLF domain-containing protein